MSQQQSMMQLHLKAAREYIDSQRQTTVKAMAEAIGLPVKTGDLINRDLIKLVDYLTKKLDYKLLPSSYPLPDREITVAVVESAPPPIEPVPMQWSSTHRWRLAVKRMKESGRHLNMREVAAVARVDNNFGYKNEEARELYDAAKLLMQADSALMLKRENERLRQELETQSLRNVATRFGDALKWLNSERDDCKRRLQSLEADGETDNELYRQEIAYFHALTVVAQQQVQTIPPKTYTLPAQQGEVA